MGAFGYRQRLDRILQETTGRGPVADALQQRLALWVAKVYDAQHPEQAKVMGVRFGQTVWAAGSPELANPAGHWVPDPPSGRPLMPFTPFAAYSVNQGLAQLIVFDSRRGMTSGSTPTTVETTPSIGKRFRPTVPTTGQGTATPILRSTPSSQLAAPLKPQPLKP